MPIVNDKRNREHYWITLDGHEVSISIFCSTFQGNWYYRANVDGETVENYAQTEGEAYRKAFEGVEWLLDGEDVQS